MPEADWKVTIDSEKIITTDPENNIWSFPTEELIKVIIQTNDTGPWGIDLWWRLVSNKGTTLSVPGGANGENYMLQYLQSLVGFNNEQVIEAMACTDIREFVCYNKKNVT